MNFRTFTLQCALLGSGLVSGMLLNLHAQISGDIEADIPFPFVVADTTFSPGSYVVHPLGGDDPAMEIRRVGGHESAVVLITRSVGGSIAAKTELLFHRFGDQEFLAKIFVEGNEEKAEIERSRTESALRKEGRKAQLHSHPARYRKTALNPS
jgi:hypothetical protein